MKFKIRQLKWRNKFNNNMTGLVKKIIVSATVFSLVLSSSGILFLKKAEALSAGEATGKAIGAGVACFAENYLESIGYGVSSGEIKGTASAFSKGAIPLTTLTGTTLTNVPAVDQASFGVTFNVLQSSEAAAYKNSIDQSLNKSKDCVRDVVAKIMLDWVVDETVKWIQGGGEPRFVTDWKNFSKDAVNVAVGEIVRQSNFDFLCSPFRLQVQLQLTAQRFPQKIECTLDKIVNNIDAFYNDFSKGGWIGYNTLWEPQNNYYGQLLLWHEELVTQAALSEEAARNEALAGQSFLSSKRCKGGGFDQEITAGPVPSYWVKDSFGKYCASKDLEILTPGNLVGRVVGEAITSDIRWAENVKSWTAAIVNAVMNRLIKEGLSAMKKSSDPAPADYGDFDPWYGQDRTDLIQEQAKTQMVKDAQSLKTDLSAIKTNKEASLSYAKQTLSTLQIMKTKTCLQPATDQEITNAQNEINRLTKEISDIDLLVANVSVFISKINSMSVQQFKSQSTSLQREYQDLVSKSSAFGIVQQSLDEIDIKKQETQGVETRLNSCTA